MAEAEAFVSELNLDIAKMKYKLEMLRNAKPVDELTVDDVYEVRPELKASFQNQLKHDNWSTDDAKEAARKDEAVH